MDNIGRICYSLGMNIVSYIVVGILVSPLIVMIAIKKLFKLGE